MSAGDDEYAVRSIRITTRKPLKCIKNFAELVAAVILGAAKDKPLELWRQVEAQGEF